MKNSTLLPVTSLITMLLFSIHWVDDVVHGIDSVGLQSLGGVAILLVWLCATLLGAERRWGLALVLIASVLSVGVTALHLSGTRIATIATSDGGFRYLWTLFMLGTAGAFGSVLSIRGFVNLRRGTVAGGP